jgi:hypothetical protein
LKGLLDSTPLFGLERNVLSRNPASKGIMSRNPYSGNADFFPDNGNSSSAPVLHQELNTDLRIQLFQNDNYMLQRLGVISCFSTNDDVERVYGGSNSLRSVLSHYSVLSLPSFTSAEVHIALVTGALVSMSKGVIDLSVVNLLKGEIADLSRITVSAANRFISSMDISLTTLLERKIRKSFVLLNLSTVEKFCLSLSYGANHVYNPGGLIQLYAHEWKRFFVDPLPVDGSQRERIVSLFAEQLDTLDEKSWSITRDFIQTIKDDLSSSLDRVWTNALVFRKSTSCNVTFPTITLSKDVPKSGVGRKTFKIENDDKYPEEKDILTGTSPYSNSDNKEAYVPVEFDLIGTLKSLRSGAFNSRTKSFGPILVSDSPSEKRNKIFDLFNYLSKKEASSLLYPSAFSYLLRIIRIISNTGKNIMLTGYPSSSRKTALLLAARICDLEPCIFRVREVNGICEMLSSDITNEVMDLNSFLKRCLLKSTGLIQAHFLPVNNKSGKGNSNNFTIDYDVVPSSKILIVIDEPQQLSDEYRRVLYSVLDNDDPSALFSNDEIQGIATALRKVKKEEDFKSISELELKSQLEYDLLQAQLNPSSLGQSPGRLTSMLTSRSRTQSLDSDFAPPISSPSAPSIPEGEMSSDEKKPVPDATSTVPTSSGGTFHHIYAVMKGDLNGYTYHWVKSRLQQTIQSKVRFAFNITIAKSMELDSRLFTSNAEALTTLRKISGLSVKKSGLSSSAVANNSMMMMFSGQSHQSSFKLGTVDDEESDNSLTIRQGEGNSSKAYSRKRMSTKRYSLLSDRSMSVDSSCFPQQSFQATSSLANTLEMNTHLLYDRSSVVGSHSLFSCSILGSILSRCFSSLWYEVEHQSAINGICTRLMKNEYQGIRNTRPVLVSLPLSIKSIEVGKYHYLDPSSSSDESKVSRDGNVSLQSAPVKSHRRMSAIEIATKDYENERRTKFKQFSTPSAISSSSSSSTVPSTQLVGKTLQNYDLLLQCRDEQYHGITSFSWISYFGIFESFQFLSSVDRNNDMDLLFALSSSDSSGNNDIAIQLSYFIEEAQILLPFLLSFPLSSCDAIFLSMPCYTNGSDTIAIRCAEAVMYILETHGKDLLLYHSAISKVLARYDEAIYALNNADNMDKRLLDNNKELSAVSRQLSEDIESSRKEYSTFDSTFQRYPSYERECMMNEEVISVRYGKDDLEKNVNDLLLSLKYTIRSSFSSSDWQSLTSFYTTKPYHKPMIEIMRAIMIVINFTPPTKGSKGGSGGSNKEKMDDDLVARYAVTLLVKYNDLINQLNTINISSLSNTQLNSLRYMNSILNSNYSQYLNPENLISPIDRLSFYYSYLDNDTAANPIFDVLRRYLLILDLSSAAHDHCQLEKIKIEELIHESKTLQSSNNETKKVLKESLKAKVDSLLIKTQLLDSLIIKNRKKLETIHKTRSRKDEISSALVNAHANLLVEYQKVSSILQHLVGDLCIAIVVSQRCGWLPDAYRQHATDQLRQHLISQYNMKVTSDNPLIVGCLLDRLQLKKWINYHETSGIPNDIPSINALSLLFLSPSHTYIIDPDGSSQHVIKGSVPENYQCFTVAAHKFSFDVLIALLQNFNVNDDDEEYDEREDRKGCKKKKEMMGMCLIINDVHCGVTEDLVCLLSSQVDYDCIDTTNSSKRSNSKPPIEGRGEFDFLLDIDDDEEDDKEDDPFLYLKLDTFSTEAKSTAETNSPRSSSSSPRNQPQMNNKNHSMNHIKIPKKFRLILISAIPPTLDSIGNSSPLPLTCLENLTILHWSISYLSKFTVDSLSIENILQKNAITDSSFSYYLSFKSLNMIFPKLLPTLSDLNYSILNDLSKVITIDYSLFYHVLTWKQEGSGNQNLESLSGKQKNLRFSPNSSSSAFSFSPTSSPVSTRQSMGTSALLSAGLLESLEVDLAPVTLSILSDEEIVNLILSIKCHRNEILSTVIGKKLLLRERNMIFSTFSEICYTMSYDYIKFCSTFLPNECFAPFALTISAIKSNLLPSLIKYGMKSNIINYSNFPICTLQLLKIWNAIIYLQYCFREKKRIRLLSSSRQHHLPFSSSSSSTFSSAVEGKPRYFLPVSNSVVYNELLSLYHTKIPFAYYPDDEDDITSSSSSNNNRMVGVIPSFRHKAMNVLIYLLLPLKSFFMKGFVRYIQLNIRPGYENITKLLLLFTTWSQSEKLPIDEIRSFFYILLENKGYSIQRFSHYLHSSSTSASSISSSNKENSSEKVNYKEKLSILSKQGARMSFNVISSSSPSPSKDDRDDLTKSTPGISALSSVSEDEELRGEALEKKKDHQFLRSLPGVKKMNQRVTAFRIHSQDSYDKDNEDEGVASSILKSRMKNDHLERGPGYPDGLQINNRSSHWLLTSSSSSTSIGSSSSSVSSASTLKCFQPFLFNNTLYDDEFQTIKPRSSIIRLSAMKYDDLFEIEWLKTKGIKCFTVGNNQKALLSLGASTKILEEINLSRQTMIRNTMMIGRKGVGMKGKESNVSSVGRKSVAKHQQQQPMIKNSIMQGKQQSTRETQRKSRLISTSSQDSTSSSRNGSRSSMLIARKTILHATLTKNQNPNNPLATNLMKSRITTKLTSRASNLLDDITSDLKRKKRNESTINTSIIEERGTGAGGAGGGKEEGNNAFVSSTIQQISQRTTKRLTQISQHLSDSSANNSNRQSNTKNAFAPSPTSKLSSIGGGKDGPSSPSRFSGSPSSSSANNDFTEIISDEKAFINLFLLENHPSLSLIFKGITLGISKNLTDFHDWKETLLSLQSIDMSSLSDSELLSLLPSVQPPKCYDFDDENAIAPSSSTDGMWSSGYELTILQSLLLSESLWPGSSHILMNYSFALITSFLSKDGYVVLHPDELTFDDDEDFEDDEPCEDEDEEDDEENEGRRKDSRDATRNNSYSSANSYSSIPRVSSANKNATVAALDKLEEGEEEEEEEEDDEKDKGGKQDEEEKGEDVDEEEEDDEFGNEPLSLKGNDHRVGELTRETIKQVGSSNTSQVGIQKRNTMLSTSSSNTSVSNKGKESRSTFFRSLQSYSVAIQSLKQSNIPFINSWDKLEKVISKKVTLKGPEIIVTKDNESSSLNALSFRDFYPWEPVLVDLINEYYDVERFVFMKDLRETLIGRFCSFLAFALSFLMTSPCVFFFPFL